MTEMKHAWFTVWNHTCFILVILNWNRNIYKKDSTREPIWWIWRNVSRLASDFIRLPWSCFKGRLSKKKEEQKFKKKKKKLHRYVLREIHKKTRKKCVLNVKYITVHYIVIKHIFLTSVFLIQSVLFGTCGFYNNRNACLTFLLP